VIGERRNQQQQQQQQQQRGSDNQRQYSSSKIKKIFSLSNSLFLLLLPCVIFHIVLFKFIVFLPAKFT